MRSICLIGAAIVAVACAAGSANAQTAPAEQPGQPLHLLAGLTPPPDHARHAHAKGAHATPAALRHRGKTHEAARHARGAHHRLAAHPATTPRQQSDAAASTAPAPNPPAAAAIAKTDQTNAPEFWQLPTPAEAADAAAAAPVPPPPTADDPLPESAVVVNGQTVQIASPDQINDIDRTAPAVASLASAAPAAGSAAAGTEAAPAVHVLSATAQPQDGSAARQVGSASWIAQVLAALGGAITAGTVAWFLIGPGPRRMYG